MREKDATQLGPLEALVFDHWVTWQQVLLKSVTGPLICWACFMGKEQNFRHFNRSIDSHSVLNCERNVGSGFSCASWRRVLLSTAEPLRSNFLVSIAVDDLSYQLTDFLGLKYVSRGGTKHIRKYTRSVNILVCSFCHF
jgi:hypothetical protein